MDFQWLGEISGGRIRKTIDDLGELAAGKSGKRIAYAFSHVEDALFKYIKSYIYELNKGYTVLSRNLDFYEDPIGNLYILIDSDKPAYAACGTHVDGVNAEGNFDGFFGAAAGLEVMRVLFEQEVSLPNGFCLIIFRAGEDLATGVRFLGSKVATGQISKDEFEGIEYGVDKKVPIRSVMEYKKYNWEKILARLETPFITRDQYKCFLELHVEPRGVLEAAGDLVGLAAGTACCDSEVMERLNEIAREVAGVELPRVEIEMFYNAHYFKKLGIPTGVICASNLKSTDTLKSATQILGAGLYSYAQ